MINGYDKLMHCFPFTSLSFQDLIPKGLHSYIRRYISALLRLIVGCGISRGVGIFLDFHKMEGR